MNKNVMIVLGGALAVAVVVALLVQVTLGGKKPVDTTPKVEVLVAANNLSIGQELKDGDTKWQQWPQDGVFPGAVIRKDNQEPAKALEGRLARNVTKGEPVVKTSLLAEAKGNFVAASLEPGMRAVAIEVSASAMVGGFIGPGDFVDVILTYRQSINTEDDDPRAKMLVEMNINKVASETILQNLKVLAVDQMAKRGEEEKVKVGKTVTLAMTAQQSEKIALAQEMGDLTLALRGVGDDKLVKKEWDTISDARLVTIDNEVFTEYEKMKNEAGMNLDIVRIYNGSQVEAVPAH